MKTNDDIKKLVFDFIGEHPEVIEVIVDFVGKYPELKEQVPDMLKVYIRLITCFENGHTLFLCGNGGSFADCMHLSAELIKSFEKRRNLTPEDREPFANHPYGKEVSNALEYGFPVHVLGLNHSLFSAIENDNPARFMEFAQELFAFGKKEDVIIGVSTSGNARNVMYAMITGKAKGLTTIALTGKTGGELATVADITIKAPAISVKDVQEFHVPIYHTLCSMVESHFFRETR